ncbi:MAG: hypothetical protein AAGJ80_14640, partial [Cyanobacteria bacterium J06553_1]
MAHHFEQTETPIKEILKKGFYVDNFVGTTNDEVELELIYVEANRVLAEANMPLQQWASNSRLLQEYIERDSGENMPHKVNLLGVNWDSQSDQLVIKNPQWLVPAETKRNLVSEASTVYDPLGLVTPITIRGRMLIQDTWKCGMSWDDSLPPEIKGKWEKVREDLANVESLMVPRRVMTGRCPVTLHVFCDASSLAYGSAAYVVEDDRSNLLMSRVRVAPLKTRSLPRLELTALLVGGRLISYLKKTLDSIEYKEIYLWSDNEAALQWVRNNQSDITYVKNRVAELRQLRDEYDITLLHVPTKDNPSDHLSRGLSVKKLADCDIWWYGPHWLTHRESWP